MPRKGAAGGKKKPLKAKGKGRTYAPLFHQYFD